MRWPNTGKIDYGQQEIVAEPTEKLLERRAEATGLSPQEAAGDPRAGSVLGILEIRGLLTAPQRRAGERLRSIHRNLDRLLVGAPSSVPRISNLERLPPGKESLAENIRDPEKVVRRARNELTAAFDAIEAAGPGAKAMAIRVAIYGEDPGWFSRSGSTPIMSDGFMSLLGVPELTQGAKGEHRKLRAGLQALANHLGIQEDE